MSYKEIGSTLERRGYDFTKILDVYESSTSSVCERILALLNISPPAANVREDLNNSIAKLKEWDREDIEVVVSEVGKIVKLLKGIEWSASYKASFEEVIDSLNSLNEELPAQAFLEKVDKNIKTIEGNARTIHQSIDVKVYIVHYEGIFYDFYFRGDSLDLESSISYCFSKNCLFEAITGASDLTSSQIVNVLRNALSKLLLGTSSTHAQEQLILLTESKGKNSMSPHTYIYLREWLSANIITPLLTQSKKKSTPLLQIAQSNSGSLPI